MRRSDLGEFEELVLLGVAVAKPNSYSVAISEAIQQEIKHTVSVGAVHASLQRLEAKEYLTSYLGESTNRRGGRSKRIFELTHKGVSILNDVRISRLRLWEKARKVGSLS